MFALEEPKSRKRRLSSQEPWDVEPETIAKKQKSLSECRDVPRHRRRSPSFWDTLSKIRLSRSSLREFERRNIGKKIQSPYTPTTKIEYPTGRSRLRLKRFARRGGPDLSHLRGLANLPPPILDKMSDHDSARSGKRSSASSKPSDSTKTTTTKTTPYSGNFEQKCIDNGIYPDVYEYLDGNISQNPTNLGDIQAAQRVPRASLSPSRFTDKDFEAFRRANAKAKGETTGMCTVFPLIAGNEATHHSQMGLPLSKLEAFDKGLSDPRPDVYHGAAPSSIHPRVRADLADFIIPSKVDTSRPAAPNFFVEGKSAQGRADVAKRQALLDGAMGARAMHQLQNYKAAEPIYDNRARSFSATYQDGILQTYAHHVTKPPAPGGDPEYHMTLIRGFVLTSDRESFVQGATAYRNTRDLAKAERVSSIARANQEARTTSRTSQSAAAATESDTSEDELARDEATPAKRLRPSAALSMSYGSATGREGRPAFGAPMAPPQNNRSMSSRRSGRPSAERSTSYSTPSTPNGTDGSSVERPSDLSRQSPNMQDLRRSRQTRPMVEVTSERMRHGDDLGWRIEHGDKSIFVKDSQWTIRQKDGRQALYCARLNVFMYQPNLNRGKATRNSVETGKH
ncbi:uncharacterized protein PV06_07266 [Exophiala oligosperma]|uniref:DUF7924 domain-containing protein n=1 Tax=Exophiala oligosperma TaxID=215243 RepID=A0A0D2BW94_9EURO|nr:uncharacterized protein PV06_07266 [Exophiala oligosperma]KIW41742.1 hypothetical protein PV06_07266 [Exophiala oligosperma]